MDPWRHAWRAGIVPQCSRQALEALRAALAADDPRLMQGCTTTPPPLMVVQDWPCEGADALGYMGWRGEGLETVGEIEKYFAKLCFGADQLLGEPAGVRGLLNWLDDTPRPEMIRELLAEVDLALAPRPDPGPVEPRERAE